MTPTWNSTPLGRRLDAGGTQFIMCGPGACNDPALVSHEFGHAIGFFHEQSRPDRDRYLRIHWQNIRENFKHNYHKASRSAVIQLSPYDVESTMHYNSDSFGLNSRLPTMTKLDKSGKDTGEKIFTGQKLSEGDYEGARELYEQMKILFTKSKNLEIQPADIRIEAQNQESQQTTTIHLHKSVFSRSEMTPLVEY